MGEITVEREAGPDSSYCSNPVLIEAFTSVAVIIMKSFFLVSE